MGFETLEKALKETGITLNETMRMQLDEYAGYVTAQNENTARYMIPFALDYIKSKG